ncbi:MAG: hypothetical protein HYX32_01415 [Actinobacteria bacterium]|nr:hypothetical protein [Actinomycetota bacterium]
MTDDVAGDLQPPDAEGAAAATGALPEAMAVLAHLLRDAGVDEREIESAAQSGSLHLLALERLIAMDPAIYTLEEATEMSGLDIESIRAYWRALGFPDPRPGEKLFSESDLDMLDSVLPFIEEGSLDPLLAQQMARVIGSSLSRIATAQIEAIERAVTESVEAISSANGGDAPATDADHEEDLVGAARRAAELLPMMPKLMEFVWRRHLGAAARRRIMRAAGETSTEGVSIGFADLVGFTAQTQQLPEKELAAVVSRFETIAYDVVANHSGRVVKMIGDEVMFLADHPRDAALIAMQLAEQYREDEAMSDVRVGLAIGGVLERDGDVYGPVVNLAHRIVAVAYPGAVVISPEFREALGDDPEFFIRSIRSHYLKDLGRIPLWTLRRASNEDDARVARTQARRLARRQFMLERRLFRQREPQRDAVGSLDLDGQLSEVFREEHADAEDATTEEYEALTDAVLEADIDPGLQVELLTDIEAARRLHQLEDEGQHRAEEADAEAERKLDEIEVEAKRKVEQVEKEARLKVEAALTEAEEKARKANEEASRKVKRVAQDVERKADRAEKEAKREAKRKTARRTAQRKRAGDEAAPAPEEMPDGDG